MLVVEFPLAQRLGREALGHDIGPRQQLQHQLACLRLAEIERDAPLRGVEAGEELAGVDARLGVLPGRRQAQHVEPRERLDPDYVGAVVGQVLGRDRPDSDPGEVEHVDSLKRVTSHLVTPLHLDCADCAQTAQPCAVDPQKLALDLCVVFAQARRAASRADRGRAELGECAGQRERAAERVVARRARNSRAPSVARHPQYRQRSPPARAGYAA